MSFLSHLFPKKDLAKEDEEWRDKLKAGDVVDVLDKSNNWVLADAISFHRDHTSSQIYVLLQHHSHTLRESIPLYSNRIAQPLTKSVQQHAQQQHSAQSSAPPAGTPPTVPRHVNITSTANSNSGPAKSQKPTPAVSGPPPDKLPAVASPSPSSSAPSSTTPSAPPATSATSSPVQPIMSKAATLSAPLHREPTVTSISHSVGKAATLSAPIASVTVGASHSNTPNTAANDAGSASPSDNSQSHLSRPPTPIVSVVSGSPSSASSPTMVAIAAAPPTPNATPSSQAAVGNAIANGAPATGAGVIAGAVAAGTVAVGAAVAAPIPIVHPSSSRGDGVVDPRYISVGDLLDVLDTEQEWRLAEVLKFRADEVYVHYVHWAEKWDEWLPRNSPRIKPPRTKTEGYTGPENKRRLYATQAPPGNIAGMNNPALYDPFSSSSMFTAPKPNYNCLAQCKWKRIMSTGLQHKQVEALDELFTKVCLLQDEFSDKFLLSQTRTDAATKAFIESFKSLANAVTTAKAALPEQCSPFVKQCEVIIDSMRSAVYDANVTAQRQLLSSLEDAYLKKLQKVFQMITVPADGSCLFAAVSRGDRIRKRILYSIQQYQQQDQNKAANSPETIPTATPNANTSTTAPDKLQDDRTQDSVAENPSDPKDSSAAPTAPASSNAPASADSLPPLSDYLRQAVADEIRTLLKVDTVADAKEYRKIAVETLRSNEALHGALKREVLEAINQHGKKGEDATSRAFFEELAAVTGATGASKVKSMLQAAEAGLGKDVYLNVMEKDGIYGTDVECEALAVALKAPLVIYHQGSHELEALAMPPANPVLATSSSATAASTSPSAPPAAAPSSGANGQPSPSPSPAVSADSSTSSAAAPAAVDAAKKDFRSILQCPWASLYEEVIAQSHPARIFGEQFLDSSPPVTVMFYMGERHYNLLSPNTAPTPVVAAVAVTAAASEKETALSKAEADDGRAAASAPPASDVADSQQSAVSLLSANGPSEIGGGQVRIHRKTSASASPNTKASSLASSASPSAPSAPPESVSPSHEQSATKLTIDQPNVIQGYFPSGEPQMVASNSRTSSGEASGVVHVSNGHTQTQIQQQTQTHTQTQPQVQAQPQPQPQPQQPQPHPPPQLHVQPIVPAASAPVPLMSPVGKAKDDPTTLAAAAAAAAAAAFSVAHPSSPAKRTH